MIRKKFATKHATLTAAGTALVLAPMTLAQTNAGPTGGIGKEIAATTRLQDGDEYQLSTGRLFSIGAELFDARWTDQEGGGRPLTTGTGGDLAAPDRPLVFPRNFNRVSAPDANSCSSCHNLPHSGGGGDFTTNVFVLAQRFDHATFSLDDPRPTVEGTDELGNPVTLDSIANSRSTVGMNGSGYIEMLARQITADLQAIRDAMAPGTSAELESKGISFGTLTRNPDGTFDTSEVDGLPAPSLGEEPNLVIRPFHQAGAVVSLRQFTNNAYNHHHGIQANERFGATTDPDGDGFVGEMTRAEATAVSVYQAGLNVPGRMIPRNRAIEDAVLRGENTFDQIGCTRCHMSALPLDQGGWFFGEPNPYNPAGNLQPGEAEDLVVNLNSRQFPSPRLRARRGTVWVPAFTDFKLHDITSGPDDPNREVLNMHYPAGSDEFFAGNSQFLTRKLWGAANEPPYYHHGRYTTMRQAVLAHAGEAEAERLAFEALPDSGRDDVIEFLKTLQVLPVGTSSRFVDENYQPRNWPPAGRTTPLLDRSDLTGWNSVVGNVGDDVPPSAVGAGR